MRNPPVEVLLSGDTLVASGTMDFVVDLSRQ